MKVTALLAAVVLGIGLAGCGKTFENAWQPPGEDNEGADGMMEGPGLFSGEDGEFTVVSTDIWDSDKRRRGGTRVLKDED